MRDIDWQIKLMDYVERHKTSPFVWGENDCVMYALGAVAEMGGPDLVSSYKGRYKTEAGAKRVLAKVCPDGLEAALSDKLEPVHVNMAQRGDLVTFAGPLGKTLGIYWIGGIFSIGPEGSVFLDEAHDKILGVWRV